MWWSHLPSKFSCKMCLSRVCAQTSFLWTELSILKRNKTMGLSNNKTMVAMTAGTTGSFNRGVYHLLSGMSHMMSVNHLLEFWVLCGSRSQQYNPHSFRVQTIAKPVSHTDSNTPWQLARGTNPPQTEEKLTKTRKANWKSFPMWSFLLIKKAGIAVVLKYAAGISNLYTGLFAVGGEERTHYSPQIRSSKS